MPPLTTNNFQAAIASASPDQRLKLDSSEQVRVSPHPLKGKVVSFIKQQLAKVSTSFSEKVAASNDRNLKVNQAFLQALKNDTYYAPVADRLDKLVDTTKPLTKADVNRALVGATALRLAHDDIVTTIKDHNSVAALTNPSESVTDEQTTKVVNNILESGDFNDLGTVDPGRVKQEITSVRDQEFQARKDLRRQVDDLTGLRPRTTNAILKAAGLLNGPVTEAKKKIAIEFAQKFNASLTSDLALSFGQSTFTNQFTDILEDINGISDPIARADAIDKASKLTGAELVAVRLYTLDENPTSTFAEPPYMSLNRELRSGGVKTPKFQALEKQLTSGLSKLPDYDGPVYRGVNLMKSVSEQYQPGNVVTTLPFESSSASPDQKFDGAFHEVIMSKHGKDIGFLSKIPSEQEVLFPPSTQFKVLDRRGSTTFDPVSDRGTGRDGDVELVLLEVKEPPQK